MSNFWYRNVLNEVDNQFFIEQDDAALFAFALLFPIGCSKPVDDINPSNKSMVSRLLGWLPIAAAAWRFKKSQRDFQLFYPIVHQIEISVIVASFEQC